jgi:sulfonate transport system substrate-binding protein
MSPSIRAKTSVARLFALLAGLLTVSGAQAEDKPKVIRITYPGVGVGARPFAQGNGVATAHLRGSFEQEFKKDGIAIQWSFLRGAGPAVNELFANDLVDFSLLGDLPSVIGRASGLKVRLLAGQSVRSNQYVAVPADSPVQSVKDLRGKRVALQKGTAGHLAGLKVLEQHGLGEKDVKLVNMDTPTAQTALATKDVDAVFGTTDYLRLRDQGIARIIYTTRGGNPEVTSNSSFIGSEKFITKYPEITKRVLKVIVQTSQFLAEAQPVQIYQLWSKSGTTFASFREDLQGEDLKYRYSPLLDPYHIARYKLQIKEAKRLGLIKQPFTYEQWVEPKFLQQALKELKAEEYWQPRGADGKLLAPDTKRAASAPAAPAPAVTAQNQPAVSAPPPAPAGS